LFGKRETMRLIYRPFKTNDKWNTLANRSRVAGPVPCSRASLRLLRVRHLALSVVSRLLRTRLPSPRTSRRFDSPPDAYALRVEQIAPLASPCVVLLADRSVLST